MEVGATLGRLCVALAGCQDWWVFQVDVYVVSEEGLADLPTEYSSPLSVDGAKIMAYNYCEPGYKQPRDVYKNK